MTDTLVLHDVLGSGSSGTVYRGEWRGLTVAVKTLVFSEAVQPRSTAEAVPPCGTDEAAGRSKQYMRAVTEAAVAWSISHRNIVATYRYRLDLTCYRLSSCLDSESAA